VLVPKNFETGSFDISIRITDGKRVSITFQNEKTEKVINGLKPKCDNVVIGYGYDSSRVIKGKVHFSVNSPYSVPRYVPHWINNGLRLDWLRTLCFGVFYFALFFAAFRLSIESEKKTESALREDDSR
jgi:hypothetical protein